MSTSNYQNNIVPGSIIEISGTIYDVGEIVKNKVNLYQKGKLVKTILLEKIISEGKII